MKNRYSDMKVEDFINNDMPLIEKMFSMVPFIREGYDVNKRELKIQKRLAKDFYNKRMKIVSAIVNSNFDDKREILVSSLVGNGFAPRTLEPWVDYVLLLSERYGGWDIFIRELTIAHNVEKESSLRLKTNILFGFVLTIPITALIKLLSPYINPEIAYSLWLLNVSFFIAWIVFYVGNMKKELEKMMETYKGVNNKNVSDSNFIKATRLKYYLDT